MWDARFERTLRAVLNLPPERPIEPHVSLADYGIDSMRTVNLLVELENAYAARLPDDALTTDTFATAATLWRTLSRVIGPGDAA